MAWSNILCKVFRDTGPVIGEGLLMGWQTDIPLTGFSWGVDTNFESLKADRSMADEMELAAGSTVLSGATQPVEVKNFTLKKRFDVSSAELHQIVDNEEDIESVVVTVLHVAHGRGMVINLPGFMITLSDCKFKSVTTDLARSDKGIDVMETYEIEFKGVTLLYLKTLPPAALQVTVPTLEFSYAKPDST